MLGNRKINHKDFHWVVEHLLSTHDRIHGCEIKIPETYFFVKGRPKIMVRTDRNGFLTAMNSSEKLELTEIRKDLPIFVRNRKPNQPSIDPNTAYGRSVSGPVDVSSLTSIILIYVLMVIVTSTCLE